MFQEEILRKIKDFICIVAEKRLPPIFLIHFTIISKKTPYMKILTFRKIERKLAAIHSRTTLLLHKQSLPMPSSSDFQNRSAAILTGPATHLDHLGILSAELDIP